jgi:hypothetical protein
MILSEDFVMETDVKCGSQTSGWTYTEIVVHDGDRLLKPTHVCGDEITFRHAPRFLSSEITICIKNGARHTARLARVLPHEPDSTRIPIELLSTEANARVKLTA